MHILPWKPSCFARLAERARPSRSLMCTHTVSIGASRPAARDATTISARACSSSLSAERPLHVHVEGVIAGAEGHALHPGAGGSDARAWRCLFRFDDRDDVDATGRQAALALERADQPVEGDDLLAALDHRQDDAVEPGTDHRHCVAVTELGPEGVDPNVGAAPARLFQRLHDERAGRDLLASGDRILEVEDHVIGATAEDFHDLSRMVAGAEESCDTRACGLISTPA